MFLELEQGSFFREEICMSNDDLPVKTIEYRDVTIEVHRQLEGAKCCSVEHDPDERLCRLCGNQLEHQEFYVLVLGGAFIHDYRAESVNEAITTAQAIIDDLYDQAGNMEEDEGSADQDDQTVRDTDSTDESTAADCAQEIDWPTIVYQMDKCGWVERAQAVVGKKKTRKKK